MIYGETPQPRSSDEVPDTSTQLGWATLPNPILTASGCAASGQELSRFFDIAELGAVVTKSVMISPRSGRATPRMAETPSGMLNSIGLQGSGIDALLETDLPTLAACNARAVVSIAATSRGEYAELARRLRRGAGVIAIEVNLSCPDVENQGEVFACNPVLARHAVSAVRHAAAPEMPVFAKLSSDVTDLVQIAQSCVAGGADGLSLINTVLAMEIDPRTLRPVLADVTGGISGPAIRPVALRCVWQVHSALPTVPIIGMGGIMSGLDALRFLAAGASAVSVGTATFHDPSSPLRVLRELRQELVDRGFGHIKDVVGLAHRPPDSDDLRLSLGDPDNQRPTGVKEHV